MRAAPKLWLRVKPKETARLISLGNFRTRGCTVERGVILVHGGAWIMPSLGASVKAAPGYRSVVLGAGSGAGGSS